MSDPILPAAFDAHGHCRTCDGFGEHFDWCPEPRTLGLRAA
jgi:hypothetical protein